VNGTYIQWLTRNLDTLASKQLYSVKTRLIPAALDGNGENKEELVNCNMDNTLHATLGFSDGRELWVRIISTLNRL